MSLNSILRILLANVSTDLNIVNLPNQLTVARFVLTVGFLIAIFGEFAWHETIALIIFVIASITDYFDGQIARARKLITNFGILMDPLADKILVCSAFIAFVELRKIAAWMVVIIVARELAITGLRLLAASKNVILAAEGYGKHKTVSQIIAIVSILLVLSYPDWGAMSRQFFGWQIWGAAWTDHLVTLAKWVAVFLTLFSGGIYLWRNRAVYMSDL